MALRIPALLADPSAAERPLWLTNARLFDGTDAAPRDGAGVYVENGRISRVGNASDGAPEGATTIDLDGKTLMPGLVNAHIHAIGRAPQPLNGAEGVLSEAHSHFFAKLLQESLRMGVMTVRDMGTFGDQVFAARQGMRYGAFRGARILTCGLIVSGTAPGGLPFTGMYYEADGPDEIRKAVRSQIRRGADFIKFMTTGARSVELEAGLVLDDAGGSTMPLQLTKEEMAVGVEEANRMGYRVAAHAEGLHGCEAAVELGMNTIDHGMYLHRRPDLLEAMAAKDIALVPTFSSSYSFGGRGSQVELLPERDPPDPSTPFGRGFTPELANVNDHNILESSETIKAAHKAGTPIAMGGDGWQNKGGAWIEILRMIHHGLPNRAAFVASTSTAARALGLDEQIGQVKPGLLADLVVVDGDPIEQPELLAEREKIWLVIQSGEPIAGQVLEIDAAAIAPEPALA
jgi:imidazolonepropionase-like amidohydrolase